ncbi:bifunctional adenosylcobinamide kinase/adenosylcobinamide-phosphate guanylyltransferase [Dendrosporobacter sp. 1207_IL3150]|uniref:bifunctional adenosylcobinamide kinase/adenosylcobinamide-phosphate guanylyltransferase n=1 Tax=Dendrosporobacter sp. 1207_IL3150 TaxID=3084054 RepID=UPI002FD9D148
MAKKIILVTGGARSGKSLFAEQYATVKGKNIAYIATAQAYDQEMKERINLHRKRRPDNWYTYESPYNAESTVTEASKTCDTILFDCLTIYTSNLLLDPKAPSEREERYTYVMQAVSSFTESIANCDSNVIIVTNEVGMGIVPENALAREYRDLAGAVNQKIAANADEVYLVVSGIPVNIKQLAVRLAKEE